MSFVYASYSEILKRIYVPKLNLCTYTHIGMYVCMLLTEDNCDQPGFYSHPIFVLNAT